MTTTVHVHVSVHVHIHVCIQAAVVTVKKSHKDGIDFLINNAGVLGTFAQIKDQ